ncbi:MAG: hypothetical protein IKY79_07290 [Bacteroidales bacterium]|nr:hypothetical protein [Bacteroidales bacterium]
MMENNLEIIRIADYATKNIENESSLSDLQQIANRTIKDLHDKENVLIFPYVLNHHKDDIDKEFICNVENSKLCTKDIMGFVGVNNTLLSIHTRFAKDDKEDFFMHYMLEKVFKINLFNLKHSTSDDNVFDFLPFLFPHFLKKALGQGLFKQYVHHKYNDANVRGTIDVQRHIKYNIPFNGKIAYNVKEYSYDNAITQLIRHTIEYIRSTNMSAVLKCDPETISCVSQICSATPSYNTQNRSKVISMNLKPLAHPYFTEYKPLQKLCLQILKHKKIKYGNSNNEKIYGVLFSGSWLWEEYLFETIIKDCEFKHPQNKAGKGGIYLFEQPEDENKSICNLSRCKRYPDYIKENFILDAKYKKLNDNKIDRNDMHQVISYMYVEKANIGGFIYPNPDNNQCAKLGQLRGYGGYIYNIGVKIHQNAKDYNEFSSEMKQIEKHVIEEITKLETPNN